MRDRSWAFGGDGISPNESARRRATARRNANKPKPATVKGAPKELSAAFASRTVLGKKRRDAKAG